MHLNQRMEGSHPEPRRARGNLYALSRDGPFRVKTTRVHIHRPPYDCGIELSLDDLTVEICGECGLSETINRYSAGSTKDDVMILKLGEELSFIFLPRGNLKQVLQTYERKRHSQ